MSLVQVATDQAQERLAAQRVGRKNGAADRKTSIAQLQLTDEKRDSDRGRRSIATCRPFLIDSPPSSVSWVTARGKNALRQGLVTLARGGVFGEKHCPSRRSVDQPLDALQERRSD